MNKGINTTGQFSTAVYILNEPPYGSEKTYNALRPALALAKKQESQTIRIFLFGDSIAAAKKSQKVAQGFYNLETMLKGLGSARNEG